MIDFGLAKALQQLMAANHALYASSVTNATLDGFTATGGNANGASLPHDRGGGMHNYDSSPALANVTFSGNSASYGGGMLNFDESSPVLTNVTFSRNSAGFGGGIHNRDYSSPVLTNNILWGNTA